MTSKRVAFTVLALAACGGGTPAVAPVPRTAAHWAYAGPEGPAAWATIDPAFATCGHGREQSPVDLVPTATNDNESPPKLEFVYRPLPLKLSNNGHTVLSDEAGGGAKILIDGKTFELAQFHVHTPSEHELKGAGADLEIHFVHKDASGGLAVVGLLAKKGAANAILAPFFENLPSRPEDGARDVPGASVDVAALIGNRKAYWAYDGSLTTPPCTEHVHWFVLDEPIEVSAEQIAATRAAVHGPTARPVQPLNARHLTHAH